ncbi:MAG: hypothetical protein ACXAEN_27470 [Candidatus Thorarchaeota archaeon]|jgi:hypothetical protein
MVMKKHDPTDPAGEYCRRDTYWEFSPIDEFCAEEGAGVGEVGLNFRGHQSMIRSTKMSVQNAMGEPLFRQKMRYIVLRRVMSQMSVSESCGRERS